MRKKKACRTDRAQRQSVLCIMKRRRARDINRASAAELSEAVGAGLATAIVNDRHARGHFDGWAALLRRVHGFGPAAISNLERAAFAFEDSPASEGALPPATPLKGQASPTCPSCGGASKQMVSRTTSNPNRRYFGCKATGICEKAAKGGWIAWVDEWDMRQGSQAATPAAAAAAFTPSGTTAPPPPPPRPLLSPEEKSSAKVLRRALQNEDVPIEGLFEKKDFVAALMKARAASSSVKALKAEAHNRRIVIDGLEKGVLIDALVSAELRALR